MLRTLVRFGQRPHALLCRRATASPWCRRRRRALQGPPGRPLLGIRGRRAARRRTRPSLPRAAGTTTFDGDTTRDRRHAVVNGGLHLAGLAAIPALASISPGDTSWWARRRPFVLQVLAAILVADPRHHHRPPGQPPRRRPVAPARQCTTACAASYGSQRPRQKHLGPPDDRALTAGRSRLVLIGLPVEVATVLALSPPPCNCCSNTRTSTTGSARSGACVALSTPAIASTNSGGARARATSTSGCSPWQVGPPVRDVPVRPRDRRFTTCRTPASPPNRDYPRGSRMPPSPPNRSGRRRVLAAPTVHDAARLNVAPRRRPARRTLAGSGCCPTGGWSCSPVAPSTRTGTDTTRSSSWSRRTTTST